MTDAERLLARDEARGKADMLFRLLELKFGIIPTTIETKNSSDRALDQQSTHYLP